MSYLPPSSPDPPAHGHPRPRRNRTLDVALGAVGGAVGVIALPVVGAGVGAQFDTFSMIWVGGIGG